VNKKAARALLQLTDSGIFMFFNFYGNEELCYMLVETGPASTNTACLRPWNRVFRTGCK